MFVLGSLGRGGAERVISILANDYVKCGWNVSICILLENNVEYLLNDKVDIIDASGNTSSRIRRLPLWLKKIRVQVKRYNPDVIVSFAARINVIVLFACMGLNKKIIVSERNDPSRDGRGAITNVLTSLLYPRASSIVFQTKRAKSYFKSAIQNNGIIIPNPIEVSCNVNVSNTRRIVTVGSLKEQKNHALLIDAFKIVFDKHPEYTLTIYGEGNLRKDLENQVQELSLNDHVFLPGTKKNIHEEISDASMFVLSSDYEGLSNALLEAMMMGLPCISTDCAGSDEYIENKVNGLLTHVGDMKGLAEAMLLYIENDQLRQECGEKARAVEKLVGVNNTLKQWHSVLD